MRLAVPVLVVVSVHNSRLASAGRDISVEQQQGTGRMRHVGTSLRLLSRIQSLYVTSDKPL